MKQKINVIDLDGTLIPYDSFRKYTIVFLTKRESCHLVFIMLMLRILKIIDLGTFKKTIILAARKVNNYEKMMKKFARDLYDDIDLHIMKTIYEHVDLQTINILCTASAEDYISHLARLLQWKYVCSKIDEERQSFTHLYGNNKMRAVEELYPSNEYSYNFAISDSLADKELLSKFDYYILLAK